MFATSREHLVYLSDVCGEVAVKQEDVVHYLGTILHSLEGHVTVKTVCVAGSGEAHRTSAILKAAIWCNESGEVLILLSELKLPIST